jgi:hypothetical protein
MACSLAAGRKEGSITRNAMTVTANNVLKTLLAFIYVKLLTTMQISKSDHRVVGGMNRWVLET